MKFGFGSSDSRWAKPARFLALVPFAGSGSVANASAFGKKSAHIVATLLNQGHDGQNRPHLPKTSGVHSGRRP